MIVPSRSRNAATRLRGSGMRGHHGRSEELHFGVTHGAEIKQVSTVFDTPTHRRGAGAEYSTPSLRIALECYSETWNLRSGERTCADGAYTLDERARHAVTV